MKVRELIKKLSKLPGDMEVVLQADSEGNGFDSLEDVSSNCIVDIRDQMLWDCSWTADEAGFDSDDDWEEFKLTNKKCVVLAP